MGKERAKKKAPAQVVSIGDGGPAFPLTQSAHWGMTLRDWFAGMALQGYMSSQPAMEQLAVGIAEADRKDERPQDTMHRVLAKRAFELADKMLLRRKEN